MDAMEEADTYGGFLRKRTATALSWISGAPASKVPKLDGHASELRPHQHPHAHFSPNGDAATMPSRKAGAGDGQADTRRSSLHRLSSIASFQTLFNRRRSANTTDTTLDSSSSNVSLTSSTTANPPNPLPRSDASAISMRYGPQTEHIPPPPAPAQASSRRSSYICLPDDPIGGMPRSRTFSNLPLPAKSRQNIAMAQSKSHTRLPAAFMPSTRLPSPPTSTRKHSHTRLASFANNMPVIHHRTRRSGIEPLHPSNVEHTSLPRYTAFKENISLSPNRRYTPMDTSDDPTQGASLLRISPDAPARDLQGCGQQQQPDQEPFHHCSPPDHQHPILRAPAQHQGVSLYRSAKDRAPTPGGSQSMDVHRWNSQPMLTDSTNIVHDSTSQHHAVKQTRLMSARQAPTPPPKAPAMSRATASGQVKSTRHTSRLLRGTSQGASAHTNPPPIGGSSSPTKQTVFHVTNAEPPSYWLGRVSSLADRYRNEELHAHLFRTGTKPIPKVETDKMHTPEASMARLRRAFEYLYDQCLTEDARESLAVFQLQYASTMGLEALSRPIRLNSPSKESVSESRATGLSEDRKATFMDRLLGRQKRRSLMLVE